MKSLLLAAAMLALGTGTAAAQDVSNNWPRAYPGAEANLAFPAAEDPIKDNLIPVQIIGTDDRQPEEEFGKAENLDAQKLLGLREIKKSISSVVPVECFHTAADGQAYKYEFNGILICNRRTLMINAHSLRKSLCKDTKHNFVCRIPKTKRHREIFINKPNPFQIKETDLCSMREIPSSTDIALVTLFDPADRRPLRIGALHDFGIIKGRQFVDVAANTSDNFYKKTEKTFMVSEFKEQESPSTAKSDMDSGPGSSGSAQLIKQNGNLLVVGLHVGGVGFHKSAHILEDGHLYSQLNYTQSLLFTDEIREFIQKNVRHAEKCFVEVRSSKEISG